MVNALLAKATNSNVNPLCLQKKSELPGAFDARSLCHKVLVPFEKNELKGALGNSNEPFLNKPARYTELKPDNPVRKGKDKELLLLLCDFLPKVNNSREAFSCLTDSLYFAIKQNIERTQEFEHYTYNMPSFFIVEEFVDDLLEKSSGGENLVLTVGAFLSLLLDLFEQSSMVKIHPVNQSGTSSSAISDIDLYLNDEILNLIEAKDKPYSANDVNHAVDRAVSFQCERLLFITGPNAKYIDEQFSKQELFDTSLEKGLYLSFIDSASFTKTMLSLLPPLSGEIFFKKLYEISKEARLTEDTIKRLIQLSKAHKIIE